VVARAKRLDNGKVVKGYYVPCWQENEDKTYNQEVIYIDGFNIPEIDPKTLEYSLDGESFYSEEYIQNCIDFSIGDMG